jgi:plastocyanin
MRLQFWVAVALTGAVVACGSGEKQKEPGSTTSAAPPPVGAPASSITAVAQPITGKTWDVKMLGDAQGYRFDPAALTIKRGDGVRWTVATGLPHNVTYWSDSIPAAAAAVLRANMPQTTAPLTGPLLTNAGATYVVSFGGAPAGTYHYYCTPHLALGMKGTITVQ